MLTEAMKTRDNSIIKEYDSKRVITTILIRGLDNALLPGLLLS